MDPLSVIASTIAVVGAISSTYKAIQHLRGLPSEFKEVNRNLPLAQHTLVLARDHLQGLPLDESSKRAMGPVVSSCEEKAKMLWEIFKTVERGAKDAEDGSMLELYRTCLLRLGKAHRVESLMQDILGGLDLLTSNQSFKTAAQIQCQMDQLKSAINQLSNVESCVPDSDFDRGINSQYIGSGGTGYQSIIDGNDHTINSGSGKQYVAQTMTFVRPETWSDILQTLHTSPYLDRKNRNPDRVPGTCEWFVRHEHFQKWQESRTSSLLWVSADPGCGKSVLSKYLVESELETTQSRTTCYFFFKDDFEDQKSANSALSCILHQLFKQREDLFSDRIRKRLEANKAQLSNSFDELWDILIMAARDNKNGELVCVLDAFDECEHQWDSLFQALRKFYGATRDFNLKFLITSRPKSIIENGIREVPVIYLKGDSESETAKIEEEIKIYIKERVSGIQKSLPLQPNEAQLLLEKLLSVRNRTYLWVYLTLQSIERDISINDIQIRKICSSLPQSIDDAYESILAKSKDPEKAKKLLHIIVAAARPLTLDEMRLALALEQHHKSEQDALQHVPPVDRFSGYMRDLCGLFVTITDSKVYLLHHTAKEFLVSNDMDARVDSENQGAWKHSLRLKESHRTLCQISVWHLLFPECNAHFSDEHRDKTVFHSVFLDYSAKNWAFHFREAYIEDNAVIESVRKICDARPGLCPTWFKIYWWSTHENFPQDFTTLMIASYFGLEQIVRLLLRAQDVEINSTDGTHQRSALSWASENGYDGVVERLIQKLRRTGYMIRRGARVDAEDRYGRTPLIYAAWNGHIAVVQRLCKAGARVDVKDKIGGTPISYALCSGYEEVVKQLMKGAKADSAEKLQRELLLSAAENGDDAVVKRLLDCGVTPGLVDSTGRTLLSYAAEGGHVAVVQLLLDKGAEVNEPETGGRTPLAWAIENDSAETVNLLLGRGAKVNFLFKLGLTEKGFWWLLWHDNGNDLYEERHWRSPLSRAVEIRNYPAVELLVKVGARPDFPGGEYTTPLKVARFYHDTRLIQLLESAARPVL